MKEKNVNGQHVDLYACLCTYSYLFFIVLSTKSRAVPYHWIAPLNGNCFTKLNKNFSFLLSSMFGIPFDVVIVEVSFKQPYFWDVTCSTSWAERTFEAWTLVASSQKAYIFIKKWALAYFCPFEYWEIWNLTLCFRIGHHKSQVACVSP